MRIVVIGAGRMGAIRVEDLAADPRVDEVLVANRTEERAAELAARFGARHLPWPDRLASGADGTVIALATDAHGGLLESALALRAPVLCEKPIALTLDETEAVIATANEHGTPLQIGFQRRFDPGLREVQRRVADGSVGVLYSMSLVSLDRTPSTREFLAGSGGIFRDLHVHDFDLVRWITGAEIASVYATKAVRAHAQYAEFDDADATAIHLVTTDGVQVVIRGTRHDAVGHDVRLELQGSGDSLAAGLTPRTPLHATDGSIDIGVDPYTGFVDRFREAFRNETAAFVSLVAGDIDNPCPPDSALESLRAAIACEQSVQSRQPVRVVDVGAAGP